MSHDTTGSALRGRRREQEVLDHLLRAVRAGSSRVLVLRGEAGAGKTAMLDYLAERAAPAEVVRVAGVEPEAEFAYSALQRLCAPLLPLLEQLPEEQRVTLSIAFGLSKDDPPEVPLLGTAVLGLFAEAAAGRSLVCVVDDAQWLDRPSALVVACVARRLTTESVAVVLAAPTSDDAQIFGGLPELTMAGLADSDARALLDSVLAEPVGVGVRDRIVAETRGNPLAVLELTGGLSPAELAFGVVANSSERVASRVERDLQARIAALPADTRMLLLAAAVEPIGAVSLLRAALERLGIGSDAAVPARVCGLIEDGDPLRFRHPLVRSACWRSADATQLRAVHAALAEAVDPQQDPVRRAWHRAHAADGPDEQVADELERFADRAVATGGPWAAAAFLERAVVLTPNAARRAARALIAARTWLDAGSPMPAAELLAAAELGALGRVQQIEVARLRARLAHALNPGRDGGAALFAAAGSLLELDVVAARETYLAAMDAALHAGRLGSPGQLARTADAARTAPAGGDVAGMFLNAVVTWSLEGYRAAVPLFRRALAGLVGDDLQLAGLAAMVAVEVYDHATWHRLTERVSRVARETGVLSVVPAVLSHRAVALVVDGRIAEAEELWDEAVVVERATGLATFLAPEAIIAAHRGRQGPALSRIGATERDARRRGIGRLLGVAGYARAVLDNGLGNYAAALDAARRGAEYPDIAVYAWSLSELVEAATRAREPNLAAEARDRLAERTAAAGTPWSAGAQALADALAGPPGDADERYREAIDQLGSGCSGLLVARARLLYGEWLRRENRRGDARVELRKAQDAFVSMGAEAFAARAGREMSATGEKVRKRTLGAHETLTPQEAQIARLAIAGQSNPEIGLALFLSPRTVEWHLRKVYTKLGVSSRRELAAALQARRRAVPQPE